MKHKLIKLSDQVNRKTHLFAALAGLVLVFSGSGNALAKSLLNSVTISAQSPAPINPGAAATYTVTLNRTGAGRLNIDLSCSGLPPGAMASFSANPLVFTGNSPSSATITLTISTTAGASQGSYTFTVTARDTGHHKTSTRTVTNTGTLTIDSDGKTSLASQTITAIVVQPNGNASIWLKGAASKPYVLQATSSLSPSAWTSIATNTTDATGIALFMDLDAGNYPMRFYRTTVAN
jgi:hypothetical protein